MKLSDLEHVYFCTGARNNDLLEYFNPEKLSFEIDERIASFKALGRTKLHLRPVAICTTSGTAVSECLSALLEAFYSDLPLLLITGDRPKRMHGKACPQTVDHEILSHGLRKTYLEVELADLGNIDLSRLSFPAHINVLIEKNNEIPKFQPKSYESSWIGFEQFVHENKSPLLLISHENKSMFPLVEKLCSTGLPIYAEILSGAHSLSTIKNEKDLLVALKRGDFSSVIRIGHTPLTKVWRLLEERPIPQFSFDERGFLALSYGSLLPHSSSDLLKNENFWEILNRCIPLIKPDSSPSILHDLLRKYPQSDMGQLFQIEKCIEDDACVYLGNSLVIRFYELVNTRLRLFFGNRGVNGIDGQLSSAIGLASSTDKLVYCLLGDLTTFYDLSALRDIPDNLKLIILNNKGGRIFQTLNLNTKLVLEHEGDFSAVARAFNLSYGVNDLSLLNKVKVLELITDPEQTMSFLKGWER